MSNTKIKIGEKIISSVSEEQYKGTLCYSYKCDDGSIVNSRNKFNVSDKISVFITKYKGNLSLIYSLSSDNE